jgi:UDP-glucose 4-epimerase
MNVAVVRYFNVYGPAQDWRRVIPPVMSSFIIRMLQGENPLIYGTGEKRRDFIYVDDVNDLHVVILQDGRADGGVFNIGSGINHSVNEIFQLVESILKTGLKPIYKPDLPGEAEITLADITAAKSLGWKPRIDIKEGLKRTIDYLQSRVLNTNASLTEGRAN